MNATVVTVGAVYLALVAAIAGWAMRRTTTARDFWIAGQRLGLLVTALATMAASFSGFLFVGGPGLTYRLGMASLLIAFPVSFTAGLLGWVLARPLREMAGEHEVYTVPDAIAVRYGGRWPAGLAAVAIVVGTLGYLGAQLQALGVVVDAVFGFGEWFGESGLLAATLAGTLVVLAYSVAGGMLAGVYTDVVQGALMVGAAVVVCWRALAVGGGLEATARTIATSESFGASWLDPLGGVPVTTAVGFFFLFGVGVLGQPHLVHKLFMIRDPRRLRWWPLVLGSTQALVVLVWLGIGLAVPALVAGGRLAPLANPDDAAPAFLLGFTSELLAGVVFAAVLAAIMSTADSFANIAAAALVRDLPRAFGRRVVRELFWGRVAVAAVTAGALGVAFLYADLIALLGTFAFGIFAAALTPCLAIGLHWPRAGAAAAVASIATGLLAPLVLELLSRAGASPLPPGMSPAVASLALSFLVFLGVGWLARR